MELPKPQPRAERAVTGEIVYLDECRRLKQESQPFLELSDMAIQQYEAAADMYISQGVKPDIMKEYEAADEAADPLCLQAIALADVLLEKRDPHTHLTFVDFAIPDEDEALELIVSSELGTQLLAQPNDQVAISSNGEHYPVLDVRRKELTLTGVSLRAWGWDHPRVVFTNKEGEPYRYPENCLEFAKQETDPTRQLDIQLSYSHPEAGYVAESLTLYFGESHAHLASQYWMSAYAETGYEGHGGKHTEATDEAMMEFLELVARIVGDEPMTIRERNAQDLETLLVQLDRTPHGNLARKLLEVTWVEQTRGILEGRRYAELDNQTLAEALLGSDEAQQEAVAQSLQTLMEEHTTRKQTARDLFIG